MEIKDITQNLTMIIPLLLLIEAVVAIGLWLVWGSKGGRGAQIAAWLGLTTLTFWAGSALAFVALNLVWFATQNQAATIIAAAIVTIFMVSMPFGWAYFVRHHFGSDSGAQQH